jgi:hypothetical protein
MPLIAIYLDEKGRNSIESVLATVVRAEGCWSWPLGNPNRYKVVIISGKRHYLHRLLYEQLVGPIPEGMEIDHRCCNPGCCNPSHLEAVPKRINILRGTSMAARWANRTHCDKGHPFDEENTLIRMHHGKPIRRCRTCKNERERLYWAAASQRCKEHNEKRRGLRQDVCSKGHPLIEGNLYFRSNGKRDCRTCVLERSRRAREKAKV